MIHKNLFYVFTQTIFSTRGLSVFSLLLHNIAYPEITKNEFRGLVLNEDEGEFFQYPDRVTGAPTRTLKIKIAKTAGSNNMSFLSESFTPGDAKDISAK